MPSHWKRTIDETSTEENRDAESWYFILEPGPDDAWSQNPPWMSQLHEPIKFLLCLRQFDCISVTCNWRSTNKYHHLKGKTSQMDTDLEVRGEGKKPHDIIYQLLWLRSSLTEAQLHWENTQKRHCQSQHFIWEFCLVKIIFSPLKAIRHFWNLL